MFKNKLKIYPLQIKKKYQDVAMLPWLNLKYEKKRKISLPNLVLFMFFFHSYLHSFWRCFVPEIKISLTFKDPRIFLAVFGVRPQFAYCVISGPHVQANKFLIHFPKTFLCKRCGYSKLSAYLLPSEPSVYGRREKMRRKAQY